jgi:ribosomal protein L37E
VQKILAICKKCGFVSINGKEKFCPNCGLKLINECPNCGALIHHPLAKYCPVCGVEYMKKTGKRG